MSRVVHVHDRPTGREDGLERVENDGARQARHRHHEEVARPMSRMAGRHTGTHDAPGRS